LPGLRDDFLETFLICPKGAETERDRAQIFPRVEREEDGFMIRGVIQKDF
jgi:hypothetical protein